jgi:hypothetical protein
MADVEDEIKESKDPGPLKLVLLCQKLGYIFEFAKHHSLDTIHVCHWGGQSWFYQR